VQDHEPQRRAYILHGNDSIHATAVMLWDHEFALLIQNQPASGVRNLADGLGQLLQSVALLGVPAVGCLTACYETMLVINDIEEEGTRCCCSDVHTQDWAHRQRRIGRGTGVLAKQCSDHLLEKLCRRSVRSWKRLKLALDRAYVFLSRC
jgi:hypothetical protein